MTSIYLITGFLGAGKTTAVNRLSACFKDQKIGVIVNEYGRTGVDSENILSGQVTEITNGSIFCACRADQFDDALGRILALTPDVILVEASGLSNPASIDAVLRRRPDNEMFIFRGVVCLIDAPRLHKVIDTALVVPKQIDAADLLVINKADLVSKEDLKTLTADLSRRRPDVPLLTTAFADIPCEAVCNLKRIRPAGADGAAHSQDLTLRKALITFQPGTLEPTELKALVAVLAAASWRVKGRVTHPDGRMTDVDAVGEQIRFSEADEGRPQNHLIVLWGTGQAAARMLRSLPEQMPAVLRIDYGS